MNVKDLKEGDKIWEVYKGSKIPLVALEDAYVSEDGEKPYWSCPTVNEKTQERLTLGSREGYEHYGPKLEWRDD